MRPMRAILIAILATAACSDSGLPLEVDGAATLDGAPRAIKSCQLSGSGLDQVLTLGLEGGAAVDIAIHESTVKLDARVVECETRETGGSGSGRHFDGRIKLACGALSIDAAIKCGTPGPSNQKRDEKK